MRYQLKAAAFAIAALPGLAAAQSSVTIYGTLNADVESVKANGATVPGDDFPSRARVSSNSSNVGFRGVEDLGSGLKAFFQIESSANLDEGGGTWASRNSAVGLTSAWGQILLGQWDTPYKVATQRLDPFGNTGIAAYSGIIGFSGSITAGQGGANFQQRASFDRRTRNVVQYWTPSLSGFNARIAYGAPDSDKPTGADSALTPTLWSLAASYESGPFYAAVAYERHDDFEPLNTLLAAPLTSGHDDGIRVGASYRIGGFTISGAYEWLKYQGDGLASAQVTALVGPGSQNVEYEIGNWFVAGSYEIGPNVLALAYGQKETDQLNGADVGGTRARQVSARWGYNFSKRTQLYAVATWISNEVNAYQTFGVNPLGATVPLGLSPSRGADPTGYGIGLIHRF
jgi:predicted porin